MMMTMTKRNSPTPTRTSNNLRQLHLALPTQRHMASVGRLAAGRGPRTANRLAHRQASAPRQVAWPASVVRARPNTTTWGRPPSTVILCWAPRLSPDCAWATTPWAITARESFEAWKEDVLRQLGLGVVVSRTTSRKSSSNSKSSSDATACGCGTGSKSEHGSGCCQTNGEKERRRTSDAATTAMPRTTWNTVTRRSEEYRANRRLRIGRHGNCSSLHLSSKQDRAPRNG